MAVLLLFKTSAKARSDFDGFFCSNNQAWSDVSDVKDILVNNRSQVWQSGDIKLSVAFPITCLQISGKRYDVIMTKL